MAGVLTNVGGTFAAATETTAGTFEALTATDVINVIGTPKFTPRGPGIISRADRLTYRGGEQIPVRGAVAWDVAFQTELYMPDPATFNTNRLARLFRACLFALDESGSTVVLDSTANQDVNATRTNAWTQQPVSMQWQQLAGRTFQTKGAVGMVKISATSGEPVVLDWTFKGQWESVPGTVTQLATDLGANQSAPIVFYGATLTLALTTGATASFNLSAFEFTQGVTLSDQPDALAARGFGFSVLSFGAGPRLVVTVASQAETTQSTWTDADGVLPVAPATPPASASATLVITVGSRSLTITLPIAKQIAYPEELDANGARVQKLFFVGCPPPDSASPASRITFA